jgi:hypothetical protein
MIAKTWRIADKKPGEPPFVTWEARQMFNRTLQFILDDSTRTDGHGRAVTLNALDPEVQEIGPHVSLMLQFLQRYHVVWLRQKPPFYEVRFQEPVLSEFLECAALELEASLLAWKRRRELHLQMLAQKKVGKS